MIFAPSIAVTITGRIFPVPRYAKLIEWCPSAIFRVAQSLVKSGLAKMRIPWACIVKASSANDSAKPNTQLANNPLLPVPRKLEIPRAKSRPSLTTANKALRQNCSLPSSKPIRASSRTEPMLVRAKPHTNSEPRNRFCCNGKNSLEISGMKAMASNPIIAPVTPEVIRAAPIRRPRPRRICGNSPIRVLPNPSMASEARLIIKGTSAKVNPTVLG